MRIYLFILFCLIISEPITVDAQNSLDSLISIFETSDSDNARSQYLNEINDLVDNTVSKDSVTAVWDKLIQICQVSEYENGINFCKYNKAKELRFKGEFFESLSLFNEVLTYYESVDNPAMVAKIHNSLGIFYKNVEDYDLAKKHYLKSIDIQRTLPDSVPLAWYYLNLGSLEEDMRDYKDAIQNLKKSEPILKKYDQKNLVNYYINFGDLYSEMGNADSAYASLSRAYQLAAENEPIEERFHSAFHLGLFLFNNNRLNESEPYLLEAETLKSNYIIADFSIDDQIRFYDIMRKYYNKKGDFEKAYNFFVMQHELEHQNTREQFQNERNLLFFEREMRLQELKNNRSRLIILITLIVLILSIVFILLLYRNYKHKQKANRLLTEMDELKTRMFSDISHELRTPLTMIIAPLEQMLSKEAKEKPSRKQIKLMRKNANAILNLINQILDLSKIDAKSMKLELVNADIVSFIRSHFVAFASVAQQKDMSFNSYTPPGKKMQLFDAAKLEKIINNLISNALKYTPKNGQVFCFANFPKSDQLELVIQDTGKGIQPEELPRIFDRFHQSTGSNLNTIGTGIGLSLTKELVELMHGQIGVKSIVGEGTKFMVSLPLGKEHLQHDEFVILEEYKTSTLPTITGDEETPGCVESEVPTRENLPEILIVEDHAEISDFIKENLQSCYKISTAPNGKRGLETAIEIIPDLIISDVMMPEMDGIEMSKKIKQDQRTSHIPIILLTGKASHKDKMQGLETGVDAFIPKPFNMKELALRIEKIIEQRQKLRERFRKNLKLEPKDIAVSSADEIFLEKIMAIIEQNISNTEFEVNQLQDELLMSRTQLFRKIKALTNQSPGDFVRTIRLKRAVSLMDQKFGNIAQITYEVGFNNPSYFAKCFKELFGMLPSEYMKKN